MTIPTRPSRRRGVHRAPRAGRFGKVVAAARAARRSRPGLSWLVTGVVVLLVAGTGVAAASVLGQPSSVVILSTPVPRQAPVRPLAVGRSTSARPAPSSTVHVRYELTGAPKAGYVTFAAEWPGMIEPLTPVRLPWRTEFDAARGFIPTITAQNSGDGVISCRIFVDGRVVSNVTSEEPFGVVTCTGSVITDP